MPEATQFRRLVVMFDGTWNEKSDWTNVCRMSEAIYQDDKTENVQSTESEPVQLVKYFAGVGTAGLMCQKLLGGSFGVGLSKIIQEAYLWLSNTWMEGDEVFVFGFSRGAYSARSLVSLMHMCGGVLTRKPGSSERTLSDPALTEGYNLYRGYSETSSGVANEAFKKKLKAFAANSTRRVRVKMLGVWDTVGSLGVPDFGFVNKIPVLNFFGNYGPWSRKHYVWHNQALPCIVDEAYHALAIDEYREDFAPTLWENRKPKNKTVEQVWFVGSHCNVGGGVGKGIGGDDLWQLSYEWMQDKAMAAGLRYKWIYRAGDKWPSWRTKLQDSYSSMLGGVYSEVNQPSYRVVVGSMASSLHPSVKLRIENNPDYRPKGLLMPAAEPNAKLVTEIPLIPLPVDEECFCTDYDVVEASNGSSATKKDL